jgi:glycosyltransferase involved in cell wall biosynthesis
MKILVVHNFYQQAGGEDQCVAAEVAMLKAHGHAVMQYCTHNDAINTMSSFKAASRTLWSWPTYHELRELLRAQRPQIVHFHNIFPLISPSAYYAAQAENVGVVQTLHNFRLLCVNGLLFRDGVACEDCLGRSVAWPGILHACYRGSRTASAATAMMQTLHRALGTWRNAVDMYIALSQSSRRKLIEGGLPGDKIALKPNFAYPDPGPGAGSGGYGVFIGRLSVEKGVQTLLQAWQHLGANIPLTIVGTGLLADTVQEAVAKTPSIHWMRGVPLETVFTLVGEAAFLVLPSHCYENFPRVIVEAFSKGTPVIVSRLGAMAELVEDGRTGLHFEPTSPEDLAAKVCRIMADPLKRAQMRQAARNEFELKYTAEINHQALTAIYEAALLNSKRRLESIDAIRSVFP